MMKSGLELAIEAAGTALALSQMIGVTPQAISQWDQVPPLRVIDVERATGVHRSVLRPDLYPAESVSARKSKAA